ncbi:MAG: hypothetical protein F7C34_00195 [Desulfurococcales archaeon]|nr:hypothetical protein [Desulfurococcales archaeon]
MPSVRVEVDEESLRRAEGLAGRLGVSVGRLLGVLLDVLGSYAGDVEAWARDLRVRREHLVMALFEELVFYGVEAKRGIVDRVLDVLRARGRFELEHLSLDPDRGFLEMELAAFEGSDLLADKLRIGWGPDGVIVEAYYYLEEYETPPPARSARAAGVDVSYLPDEHAIVVTATGRRLRDIPPVHVLDRIARP